MFRVLLIILFVGGFLILSAQENSSINQRKAVVDPPDNSYITPNTALSSSKSSFPIIAVGEMRRVSTLESFYVWESFVNGGKINLAPEINDEERLRIIRNIASKNPGLLVMLGNMVNYGAKEHNWEYFDDIFRPLSNRKIPTYAILGEHEYWGRNSLSKKYIYQRFPVLGKSSWYSKKSDGVIMLFLNSNEDEMTNEEWESQQIWFEKQITSAETDKSIKGVIVFVHHAPFTNSDRDESDIVKSTFLPRFIAAKKTMLMVSGNCATYERFDKYGKAFIVSGGGGAPRSKLSWDSGSHKDEYRRHLPDERGNVRPFNYVQLDVSNTGILVSVTGLNKGNVNFFVMEEFEIPFPQLTDKPAAID
ncbi:MAG: hypothetical protein SCALA702_19280 [Melioribacteraceae bacterium]|nr:MAG: hypothetical protein SCALA702_19280 [Melioribacteraceae bacterium]